MSNYAHFYTKFYVTLILLANFTTYTQDQAKNTKPLTLTQSILVGGAVGAAEVAFPGQVLSYAMNRVIEKAANPALQQAPLTPRAAYTGFTAHTTGQMPITALQKVVQVKGTALLQARQATSLSDAQKASISFTAGVCGALVDTPSNAIQLCLQEPRNQGKSTAWAVRELDLKGLRRGFTPNAVCKEGPFAVGYQWLAPKTSELLEPYTGKGAVSTAVGGAIAGVVTAIGTQPGAVLRNTMQKDLSYTHKTTWATAKNIYDTKGSAALFAGLPQRGTRVLCAVPLYVAYTKLLEDKLKE